MSGIIPKEELASFQRWQADAFDGSKAPSDSALPAGTASSPQMGKAGKPAHAPKPAAEPVAEQSPAPAPAIPLPTAEEIEAIHENARKEGYEAGLEAGRKAAEEEARASEEKARAAQKAEIAKIHALTASLDKALSEVDQALAEQLLDLSLEVAHQVIRGALNVRPELLIPLIREAMQSLPIHHGNVALHLHPEDASLIQDSLKELSAQGGLHVAPDSTLKRGGCLLKAGHSQVDATIETRWRRVLEAIGADPEPWLNP